MILLEKKTRTRRKLLKMCLEIIIRMILLKKLFQMKNYQEHY